MSYIEIVSPKYGVHKVFFSAKDLHFVKQHKWHVCKFKHSHTFYATSTVKRKTVYMHRLIMGNPKEIDHKDGNGLNNRRSNLRVVTHRTNVLNRGIQKNNTVGYRGVYRSNFVTKNGEPRYVATTRYKRKMIFGGYFKTIEEAALAYNKLALKYHGKDAQLNIIKKP